MPTAKRRKMAAVRLALGETQVQAEGAGGVDRLTAGPMAGNLQIDK